MTHELIDTGAYQDDYGTHVITCAEGCGYELHVPWRDERLIFGEHKRISHEREIQQAIDDGLTGWDLFAVCEQYARPHSWANVPWLKFVGLTKE